MMRSLRYGSRFKRDLKALYKGKSRKVVEQLQSDLKAAIELLALDARLAERYLDHPLTGDWADFRDCHVRPDLLLIYRKIDDALHLVRVGTHSDLFKN